MTFAEPHAVADMVPVLKDRLLGTIAGAGFRRLDDQWNTSVLESMLDDDGVVRQEIRISCLVVKS